MKGRNTCPMDRNPELHLDGQDPKELVPILGIRRLSCLRTRDHRLVGLPLGMSHPFFPHRQLNRR